MITIDSLIPQDCIVLDKAFSSKSELLEYMVNLLVKAGVTSQGPELFKGIQAREKLGSTGLGLGCAVPHAHLQSLSQTYLSVCRLSKPLDFGAPDGEGASLVFLMAGPSGNPGLHLKLLSKLARFLHDGPFRENLLAAPDSVTFRNFLLERES